MTDIIKMHCALWFECVMRWERSYRVCLSPIYADGTSDEIIYRGEGQEGRFIFARISNKNLNEGE